MSYNKRPTKYRKTRDGAYRRAVTSSVPRAVTCYCPKVCPDVMRVKLTYNDTLTLSGSGIASFNANVYRGNSLFDPDLTGAGGQPLGRDQWLFFYRRYRVLATTIEWCPQADTAGVVMRAGIVCQNTSSLGTARGYQEAQYSKFKPLGNTQATGQTTIKMYMSTDQMRGMPKGGTRINPNLSALFSTNPAEEWFIHCVTIADDGTLTWSVSGSVKITYDVELYDRETLLVG